MTVRKCANKHITYMFVYTDRCYDVMIYIFFSSIFKRPVCCHLFVVGGIEYLSYPDSYPGWSFYTPVRATQVRQVEGSRSDKVAAQSNLSFNSPYFLSLFLLFLCFSRPYVTFLRCLDEKPLSLTVISPFSVLYSSVYIYLR